jgi:hypothetical protein
MNATAGNFMMDYKFVALKHVDDFIKNNTVIQTESLNDFKRVFVDEFCHKWKFSYKNQLFTLESHNNKFYPLAVINSNNDELVISIALTELPMIGAINIKTQEIFEGRVADIVHKLDAPDLWKLIRFISKNDIEIQ